MCENILPDCWEDDVRMGALFSPFRRRNVNPLDWETKLKFWENLIEKWCICKKQSKVSLQVLKRVFQRKGTTPLCLETVLEEMLRNGKLLPFLDFIKVVPQETWTAWAVNVVVKRPAAWTFSKLKESLVSSTIENDIEYVLVAAVKLQADELLRALPERDRSRLWEVGELCKHTGRAAEEHEELVLTVHWLRRCGQVAVWVRPEEGSLLVKVTQVGSAHITEVDLGAHALRSSESTLTRHLEQLEEEREAMLDQARDYARRGMKHMAKSCLRRRQQLEKCVEKRISALENVRHLLGSLQDTQSDAQIGERTWLVLLYQILPNTTETEWQVLEAYRAGVAALRTAFKDVGLTEDAAASTMLQVQEVLDVHDEINAALSQPLSSSVDKELEEELAELLADTAGNAPGAPFPGPGTTPQKDTVAGKKEDEPTVLLPEVPSHEPSLAFRHLAA